MRFDINYKPETSRSDYGWHSRGRLPHLDADEFTQFVTFRLYDSMPQTVLDEWRETAMTDAAFCKKVEKFLDAGYGECWLRIPEVAKIVADSIRFYNGKRYDLYAWVVMPNHGHVLFKQFKGEHLPEIMHSIKSYSAQMANKVLGRSGQFWRHESFDRYIRNDRHFTAVVKYIEENPVKARVCASAGEWRYSSAYVE